MFIFIIAHKLDYSWKIGEYTRVKSVATRVATRGVRFAESMTLVLLVLVGFAKRTHSEKAYDPYQI